jgi:predicted amidohydrolase
MIQIHPPVSGVRIRLGSFQGPLVEGDVDANLRKVREVYREHAPSLDFLCFPETYLSGYAPESIAKAALEIDDPRLQELAALTAGSGAVLLVGLSERRADGVYNTVAVYHEGRRLGVQTKTMLTHGFDDVHFRHDPALEVFEAHGVRFGVAICHTTSFVEPALVLRLRGARLLFTPHFNDIRPETHVPGVGSFSSAAHREMVLNNQSALATLLKMVVVRSNVVVVAPEHLGWGDSDIWDMDGCVAARGVPFTECVVKAEFPLEAFTKPNWIDRREVPPALYRQIAEAAEAYVGDKDLT